MRRKLGNSGIEVSALGMGCWAIGGPYRGGSEEYGWGSVDDDESVRGLHRALELGVTFFDTADSYGAGHSERLLGRAFGARRSEVVIASKWGNTFDEQQRLALGQDGTVAYLRSAVDDSLRRLGTDYIDLYQLHIGNLPIPEAMDLIEPLEELVGAGKIRAFGWSTDDSERAATWAEASGHLAAVQYDHSVLRDSPEMVAVCERFGLAGIDRGPLAMGLLSGKYHDGRAVAGNDVRSQPLVWMTYFQSGRASQEWLDRIDAVREVLTSGGRTLAQGALAWLWARSEASIPIPGFRSVAQVEQNAGALSFGALTADEFAQVEKLLDR
jgi:aryl-alcohol dehydrogenase-like predicted oxidoreductase